MFFSERYITPVAKVTDKFDGHRRFIEAVPVVKCLYPRSVKLDDSHYIPVPCGHCIACRMRRTREWSLRLEMEVKDYTIDEIQFVTLTYSDENLPVYVDFDEYGEVVGITPTLMKRDVQTFMKRLRKRLDYPIRYFFVGEYGSRTERPHYHAIIYGLKTADAYKVKQCWNNGFVLVKPFFNETTVYVAGYIQKKLFGKVHYKDKQAPFLLCSQKLGLNFVLQPDILEQIKRDPDHCIYVNGYKRGLPRYLRRKLVELGHIADTSYDELVDRYEEKARDFENFVADQDTDYYHWINQFEADLQRKFVKSNRKRNSNTEV